MANSLQDQLLKAGAINKQKANQVKAEKRKKNKQKRQTKTTQVDAEKLAIQKAQAEKALKDKQLNLQKQQSLQSKAIDAQIQQLIDTHSIQLHQDQDDIAYHFQVGNKVKTIYINQSLRTQLSDGKLAIIKFDNRFVIVPVSVADKIHELNGELLIIINQSEHDDSDSTDGYEGYDVPSDLIW